jgi:hypothetical protein
MGTATADPSSDWDGHLLLHDPEGERLDGVTAWVRRGLKVISTEAPGVHVIGGDP